MRQWLKFFLASFVDQSNCLSEVLPLFALALETAAVAHCLKPTRHHAGWAFLWVGVVNRLNRLTVPHPQHAAGGVADFGADAVSVAFGGDEFAGQLKCVLAVSVGQRLIPLHAAALGLLFGVVDEVKRQRLSVADAYAGAWCLHRCGHSAGGFAHLANGDEDGVGHG